MIGRDTNVLMRYLVQDDPVNLHARPRSLPANSPKRNQASSAWSPSSKWCGSLRAFASVRGRKSQPTSRWCWRPIRSRFKTSKRFYHAVAALRNVTGTFEDALIGAWEFGGGVPRPSPSTKGLCRDCTVSHWHDRPFAPESWRRGRFRGVIGRIVPKQSWISGYLPEVVNRGTAQFLIFP
jgi:hypothetical protein